MPEATKEQQGKSYVQTVRDIAAGLTDIRRNFEEILRLERSRIEGNGIGAQSRSQPLPKVGEK
ncbi:MAG: hypothetical protein KGH94_04090 [Candidatus Micrarchaeota archaeon]|nr:hypothetical protein [Candidatus Micrarchaeota archaeon]